MLRSAGNFVELRVEGTGLVCPAETLTKQSEAKDTDINVIVERFLKTGMLPQARVPPTYGDFSQVFDFQSAMNVLNAARDAFMSYPAKLRAYFNNDPGEFVAFCEKEENLAKLREFGLASPEKIIEELKSKVEA